MIVGISIPGRLLSSGIFPLLSPLRDGYSGIYYFMVTLHNEPDP